MPKYLDPFSSFKSVKSRPSSKINKSTKKVSKKKVSRTKRGSNWSVIAPGQSFHITGLLPREHGNYRLTIGINDGPEMFKSIMDHAKQRGYQNIRVEKISSAEADRLVRSLTI